DPLSNQLTHFYICRQCHCSAPSVPMTDRPLLGLFDPDCAILDLDGIGIGRLERREAEGCTGANVEACTMARALHLALVDDGAFNQRAAIMRAHIFDGVDLALQVE